ncbi:2-succinylbenzoate--CoA ligase [Marinomonas spartinae]|uniref:AMP-binding protein n=1 Tax=Marinomonas spartinae TaxID=1792290 RepID=UPI000808D5D8|nr:AMP-binding protein [Marinomonas spartinae]SBS40437.1 2-succinylbenzoate--CoA ligase [Marinomonas spartinae]
MLLLETKNKLDENIFLLFGEEEWSYNQVFDAGDKLFNNKNKELVLILCEKNIATIVAYVGALRNNKVPLLVDREYKLDLIYSFIEKYSPHYIFSSDDVGLDNDNYINDNAFLNSCVYRRIQPHEYQIDDDLALLIPTSGSTGDPKCVRISYKNIDACTHSICEYLNYDQNRVAISFLPIHYSYGLSVLHNCIYKRAKYAISKLTILDKGMWDDVEKYQVTDFSGVPFTLKLMRKMKLDYEKVKSLQYVTQAGGYLPEADSSYFYKEFSEHGIRYFTMYGQTEASPRISYLDPAYAEEKAGTVGVPISCGSVFIAETGEKTGTGELCYKGDNVALGYATGYEDLSLGDQFCGVLKTGDIVDIDVDGFIKIIGRNKRFIKISGISINLDKVEKDLSGSFSSIVLVGKDDKLVAVTENEEDQPFIKSFISDKYGFNKTLIKTKVIDSVPLNASGKTDYKLLNEKYC